MDVAQYIQLGLAGVALLLMYNILIRVLESNTKLSNAIDNNTAVTNELYTYVKVRNGTLERLVTEDPGVRAAAEKALKRQE